MDFNKRVIVGIKGRKGSGKDTIASMIHYIMAVGITGANMDGWENYIKNPDYEMDVPSIHFADKIKDDLSVMFGINRDCFNNWEYKENKYFHFKTKSFLTKKEFDNKLIAEITLENLKENTLAKWREPYNDDCVIKLRTLMQYYGSEIIRNNLGINTWVNIAINKAITFKNYYGYAVIADVRYANESDAIYNVGGKCIFINKHNSEEIEHSSEEVHINNKDYVIDNNGTLLGLFYKVLEFVKEEMM